MTNLIQSSAMHPAHSLRQDIELLFSDIKNAAYKSNLVKQHADNFNKRGFWAQVSGNLTGQNDTDLSTMISDVSESLQITQRVVEMLLKLQSEKNVVLKDFHRAVTEKIVELQSSDDTLDINLKENLLIVFEHLQKQVADKLEQASSLELQKLKLISLEQLIDTQSKQLSHQQQELEQLRTQLESEKLFIQKHISSVSDNVATLNTALLASQEHWLNSYNELEEQQASYRKKTITKRDMLLFVTSSIAALALSLSILSFYS